MSNRKPSDPDPAVLEKATASRRRKPYARHTLSFEIPADVLEQGNAIFNGRFPERLANEARTWMGKVAAVLEEVVARKDDLDAFDAWLINRGADFRRRREAAELSCLAVAKHAGVDQGRYWRYEKAEKSLPIAAICAIERFLGGEPPSGWNIRLVLDEVSFWRKQKKPPPGTVYVRASVPLLPDEMKAFNDCSLALGLRKSEVLRALACDIQAGEIVS